MGPAGVCLGFSEGVGETPGRRKKCVPCTGARTGAQRNTRRIEVLKLDINYSMLSYFRYADVQGAYVVRMKTVLYVPSQN